MKQSDICAPDKCTGCMACKNACPKQCISFKANTLGHLHPEIDQSVCVNCKLCEKVCPENSNVKLQNALTAYAAWHKNDKEYISSTSGGAAAALSQYVIKNGGVVYGCSAQSGLKISHVRIDNLEDLSCLKGSKYVQSDINDSFKQVRTDLKEGKTVLFIGTPCQVAGLKSFLMKDYENLYCVDLICHGVPSQVQLKRHIKYVVGDKADSVQFRKGNDMGLRLHDAEGKMIYYYNVWRNKFKDSYYGSFIDGYSYRDSCYNCRYACGKRVSDITIGDFWGLSDEVKHDSVNGCSCVLPITTKGNELVRLCDLNLIERPVEEAIKGNSQLRNPSKKSLRAIFYRIMVPAFGYEAAYKLIELDRIVNHRLIKPIRRRLKL